MGQFLAILFILDPWLGLKIWNFFDRHIKGLPLIMFSSFLEPPNEPGKTPKAKNSTMHCLGSWAIIYMFTSFELSSTYQI